jgi:hypothetical protein
LRDFIEKDPRWTQGRLRWDHVIVLANTELPDDFDLPDCPRWKVIDRNDLRNLVAKLRYVLLHQELDRPLLTRTGIDQLGTALSGRGLPQRDVISRALANEDAADALTEHQAVILDAIRLLNRVEIRGGAGSGKTFLAMEQARRLAQRGQRVALVCYSHGLASYLERIAATWPRRQQPPMSGSFTRSVSNGARPKDRTKPCATRRLVVNDSGKFERSRERLYVGLSRARDQLVVAAILTSSGRWADLISRADSLRPTTYGLESASRIRCDRRVPLCARIRPWLVS